MDMKENTIYQLHDAKMDMLKKLNVLTDCERPSFHDVEAMGIYAKAIKDLQLAEKIVWEHGEHESEEVAAYMTEHKK